MTTQRQFLPTGKTLGGKVNHLAQGFLELQLRRFGIEPQQPSEEEVALRLACNVVAEVYSFADAASSDLRTLGTNELMEPGDLDRILGNIVHAGPADSKFEIWPLRRDLPSEGRLKLLADDIERVIGRHIMDTYLVNLVYESTRYHIRNTLFPRPPRV